MVIKNKLTVSVVVITMDRPVQILHSLDLLLDQKRLPEEIIVIDASKTSCLTESIISSRFRKFGMDFVYKRTEPSTSGQRNLGAEIAKGDVIFFIDDDILLDPNHIHEIMSVYENHTRESVGGVRGNFVSPYRPPSFFLRLLQILFLLEEYSLTRPAAMKPSGYCRHTHHVKQLTLVPVAPSGCISFWRKAFLKYRFDTTFKGYVLGEDVDLTWRISREYPIYHIPGASFQHLEYEKAPDSRYTSTKRWFAFHKYFFYKNFGSSAKRRLFRIWADTGYVLINLTKSVFKTDFELIKGTIAGLFSPVPTVKGTDKFETYD